MKNYVLVKVKNSKTNILLETTDKNKVITKLNEELNSIDPENWKVNRDWKANVCRRYVVDSRELQNIRMSYTVYEESI